MLEAICIIAYFGLAIWFWPGLPGCCRTGWLPRLLPIVPLVPHLFLLHRDILGEDGLHLGFAVSLSAVSALTVLTYTTAAWRYHLAGVLGFVLALAGSSVLLEILMPPGPPLAHTDAPLFHWHLLVAFAAYSLLSIAALHAILIALAEKHLHQAVPPRMLAGLPPLLTLEKLLFRIIQAGFVLLTLTVVSGIGFSQEIFGKPVPFNHMSVFGFAAWLIFAALLGGRHIYGWRGRTAISWTLAGFTSLVLAYAGVKFVLEVILGR
ncbi:MAG TPA: cytochrome c biogenesis protein CcsA [Thiobacillaceae bacterium]|nr:cytochrome c biogenesis protein CcsA [Thiobacillaceae bacterium]HNU62911.1 cytochrome c biogenesis protein CcsA [Thiobacillaceae bacterium]